MRDLSARALIKKYLIVIIITVAFVLRVTDIGNTPKGLHADEASYLVNTIALLETGHDEDGRLLPISLNSIIDPKPALYSYLQIPFVALFGPTVSASRLPAVLLSLVSLLYIYKIFVVLEQKRLGVIVIAVLAISPWHIAISRGSQEVITSFTFFTLSWFYLLKFLKDNKKVSVLLFFLFLFMSMYMYHSAKIVLPLFFVSQLVLQMYRNVINRRNALLLIVGVCATLMLSLLLQDSSIRLNTVSILRLEQPLIDITEQTYAATGRIPTAGLRIFYNKPIYYGREIVRQYVSYFSPTFLFFDWSEPRRYFVPFHGLMYLIEIPLLVIGIIEAIKHHRKITRSMLLLLLIAPLPAVLTSQEIPSTIRSFTLILPLSYFVAIGIDTLLSVRYASSRINVSVGLGALYLVSLAYFVMQYGVQQKVYQPWYRDWPHALISESVGEFSASYEHIVVINDLRPLYAYLTLRNELSIADLQANPLARMQDEFTLGKYTFNQSQCDSARTWEQNTLYVLIRSCVDELANDQLKMIRTLSQADGSPDYAFVIYEQKQ